jgi:hypothetical protein
MVVVRGLLCAPYTHTDMWWLLTESYCTASLGYCQLNELLQLKKTVMACDGTCHMPIGIEKVMQQL